MSLQKLKNASIIVRNMRKKIMKQNSKLLLGVFQLLAPAVEILFQKGEAYSNLDLTKVMCGQYVTSIDRQVITEEDRSIAIERRSESRN
jgi:poly(3-hydroxyalkanoate) synthetase